MKEDFCDRTLIRLKRQYSKDEVVAALIKKLSDKEVKIGELSAEVDFLQAEIEKKEDKKEVNRLAKIEARKNELYAMKVEECKRQLREIKELRRQRDDLIAKYHAINLEHSTGKEKHPGHQVFNQYDAPAPELPEVKGPIAQEVDEMGRAVFNPLNHEQSK